MSRYLTFDVFDTGGKDRLQASELVNVIPYSTFHGGVIELADDVADCELKSVRVQEFECAPNNQSTIITGAMLFMTIAQLDITLLQQRKEQPGYAGPTGSLVGASRAMLETLLACVL